MASLQSIKKRLQGIKNINQMTSAMELVAATKMRKAQEAALSSRAYAFTALELLANLMESLQGVSDVTYQVSSPLLTAREVKKTAVLLVAADKGLAGSFNSAVFKKFESYLSEHLPARRSSESEGGTPDTEYVFLAIGQKAIDYLKRKSLPIEHSATRQGDIVNLADIDPLTNVLVKGYENGTWDQVIVFSTHFMSALKQEVFERQLLPIDFAKIRATVEEIIPQTGRYSELKKQLVASRPARPIEYLIEPSPEEALNHLLPLLFKMQVYHITLEANASEHSARRMAMKNASDNASDLTADLTREFNRSRQAAITKEIIEITSTAAALNK